MTLTKSQLAEIVQKPGYSALEPKKPVATVISHEPTKADIKAERKLQDLIANWLLLNGIYFVRQRMDRKSNVHIGAPDFHVCGRSGEFIGIEVKVGANHETPEQARELQRIRDSGGKAFVVRSLEEVKTILEKI